MACEREIETVEETTENTQNKEIIMENTQAGVLVLKEMPEFTAEAYNAETGHYTEVNSEDTKGNGQ